MTVILLQELESFIVFTFMICRILRMTQSVEVLPSLSVAPRVTLSSDNLHRSLLQLTVARPQV